jgi:hypothetical protein
MQLELTDTERTLVLSALEAYRRIKAAEGKLALQKALKVSKEESQGLDEKYQRLHALNVSLQERLR